MEVVPADHDLMPLLTQFISVGKGPGKLNQFRHPLVSVATPKHDMETESPQLGNLSSKKKGK
jgi:hypothetical protein